MAETYTIRVDAGATFSRTFEYTDDDNEPMDLTGYTAAMHIRETPDASLALSITPVLDTVLGTITVNMSATQTSSLTLPRYVYAIELTKNGQVIRFLQGRVSVSPEVVHA